MNWKFDQAPNVACITCRPVMDGSPVLVVTHYKDDHSWAFLDGQVFDQSEALLVAMSTVIEVHPCLHEIAHLAAGWTATRAAPDEPWTKQQDTWVPEEA